MAGRSRSPVNTDQTRRDASGGGVPLPSDSRSQSALIAYIDLLFLLVAFFILVLFFIQQKSTRVEQKLEAAQEKLEQTQIEKTAIEKAIKTVEPMMEHFLVIKDKEIEKRRVQMAREKRKAQKNTEVVEYKVAKNGTIIYQGQVYTLDEFHQRVVDPKRKTKWLAFRALASPLTPFGQVVNIRNTVLKNQGEFDAYWDNLSGNDSGGKQTKKRKK
ncbi:MAG: hypothetical protein OEW12_03485 [Deltaproteobacteria bacterium]|nr:hypothetical protein [Deltaproteobacteria bacterium]